jgi:hypothetical protein
MAKTSNGSGVALAGRLQRAEAAAEGERKRRRLVEQKFAGTRSAVARLQAVIARRRAEDAARKARSA